MMTSYPTKPLARGNAVLRALGVTSGRVHWTPAGGRNPEAPVPWDSNGHLDCSGFVAWCLGYDRYREVDDTWLNTTEILAEAQSEGAPARDYFRFVGKDERVLPGDVLVYGWKGDTMGHTGVITDVLPGFVRGRWIPLMEWWRNLRVTHCSPSNERTRASEGDGPHAIATTDARIWRRAGVIVRYTKFVNEG